MEVSNQPHLAFHGVDIVQINFNSFALPEDSLDLKLSCIPKVSFPIKNKKLFNIVIDVKIEDEKNFELELRAVGRFEVSEDITEEIRKKFINSNAPAIMFPYVRAFVTTLSSNLGKTIGTLWIPTQFFKGDLEEIEQY